MPYNDKKFYYLKAFCPSHFYMNRLIQNISIFKTIAVSYKKMLIIMGVTKGGQGVSWPPWTLNIPLYVLVLAQ